MPLPLHDVRVVTIAINVPGPLCAARLREHGARVIKIEPPSGDPLQTFCPGWYNELNAGATIERLDLKSTDGRTALQSHLAGANLFLASQRPSALARLGLDAATLLDGGAAAPALRWLNIVGEVDQPEVPGHDLTYLARARLLGGEMPRTLMADVLGAERAVSAALVLLRQPPGTRATVGLFDSLAPLVAPMTHGLTGPGALFGGELPAYGLYQARTGRVAVAALEPQFRRRLYALLELPDGADLTAAFASRTAAEWESWALTHDLPVSAVRE
jgi:alpha-methylacyl-CoA racemase